MACREVVRDEVAVREVAAADQIDCQVNEADAAAHQSGPCETGVPVEFLVDEALIAAK